jgi:3-methyladenine DNA glycosylase AlkC
MSHPATEARRGARRPQDVPATTRRAVESGEWESANFAEQSAVSLVRSLETALPGMGWAPALDDLPLKARLIEASERLLSDVDVAEVWQRVKLGNDLVRSVGALAIGRDVRASPSDRLALVLQAADDRHFAVREWAWIGLRDSVLGELEALTDSLESLARAPSLRVRRFAVEITRPVGVWSRHLDFDPRSSSFTRLPRTLLRDPSRYVQDSVANWMNDAGRQYPNWTREECARWMQVAGDEASVRRIVRRGLRSLK